MGVGGEVRGERRGRNDTHRVLLEGTMRGGFVGKDASSHLTQDVSHINLYRSVFSFKRILIPQSQWR